MSRWPNYSITIIQIESWCKSLRRSKLELFDDEKMLEIQTRAANPHTPSSDKSLRGMARPWDQRLDTRKALRNESLDRNDGSTCNVSRTFQVDVVSAFSSSTTRMWVTARWVPLKPLRLSQSTSLECTMKIIIYDTFTHTYLSGQNLFTVTKILTSVGIFHLIPSNSCIAYSIWPMLSSKRVSISIVFYFFNLSQRPN